MKEDAWVVSAGCVERHLSLSHQRIQPNNTLVENERLVTKKMTKIYISMTTFGLAIVVANLRSFIM